MEKKLSSITIHYSDNVMNTTFNVYFFCLINDQHRMMFLLNKDSRTLKRSPKYKVLIHVFEELIGPGAGAFWARGS